MKSKSVVFTRKKKSDKVYEVEVYLDNDTVEIGPVYFSFDTKHIFNFWPDYPKKLTSEQKWLFDDERPYWAKFNLTDEEAKELAKDHPIWKKIEDEEKNRNYEDDGGEPYEQVTKDISEVEFETE